MNIQYKNFLVPQIQNTVIVMIIAVAVFFAAPCGSEPAAAPSLAPLSNYLLSFLQPCAWLSRSIGFVWVSFVGFLLILLNSRYSVIRIQTFLPALLYIITAGLSGIHSNLLSGGNIAAFFVLLSLFAFLSVENERDTDKIFNTFFTLSLASLFVLQTVLLLPFYWLCLWILLMPTLRTFLASVTGLIVPYLFALPVYFYHSGNILLFWQERIDSFSHYSLHLFGGIYLLVLSLVLLVSFVSFLRSAHKEGFHTRKLNYLLYVLMLGSITATLLSGRYMIEMLPVTALNIKAQLYFTTGEQAKLHAESEFEKYRIVQDRLLIFICYIV